MAANWEVSWLHTATVRRRGQGPTWVCKLKDHKPGDIYTLFHSYFKTVNTLNCVFHALGRALILLWRVK